MPHASVIIYKATFDEFSVEAMKPFNNEVERQNRSFKYQFLSDNRDKTPSGIFSVLATEFLPVCTESKYCKSCV